MNPWAARGIALGLWILFVIVYARVPLPVPKNVLLGIAVVWHIGIGIVAVQGTNDKPGAKIGMALLVALLSIATGLLAGSMMAP